MKKCRCRKGYVKGKEDTQSIPQRILGVCFAYPLRNKEVYERIL
jgi:hypothetical protein